MKKTKANNKSAKIMKASLKRKALKHQEERVVPVYLEKLAQLAKSAQSMKFKSPIIKKKTKPKTKTYDYERIIKQQFK